ncbi:DUF368 domain-containing protein [Aliivibrio kagoshimensis]|uniref:DUF368 domain-containing protein n=1 Tax=Aliivibrio kagoshimensis TaxID=2910230 RepID=UPI003D1196FE
MSQLSTFFKGMAMGAADVVPGVSGGTIAFITGIYDTLIESIRRVNPHLFSLWRREGFKVAFNYINGFFLITLFAGILTSIFSLAKLISWLLETHPIPLWSFFFGLIMISVVHMIKQVDNWQLPKIIALIGGAIFAYAITSISPITLTPSTLTFFFAGTIAICAMILPGISGSFILLLLGMYTPILSAAKSFDIVLLLTFAMGCLVGLLTFSHVLSYLFRHFRDLTITFLTGLMLGTLPKIWPWKETISWRTNSKGEQVPLLTQNLSPFDFESVTGQPALLVWGVIAMIFGVVLVWSLEQIGKRAEKV